MRSNYRKIGELIRLVDERNKGLKVSLLLGLTIAKKFISSVANIIGTDMENYKIIRKNQFACSLMQVRRDKKMPVALLQNFDEAIISQAYPVFEVNDEKELLSEYLMMWFTREEFDREACFYAVGGVRGSLEWEDFCNMKLPIPDITKQQEIVDEYNTIKNRLSLNNGLINELEETAQAIYREWFVDFEFPDENGKPYKTSGGEMEFCSELEKEVPKGWKVSHIQKEFDITIGRTPPREEIEWFTNIENNSLKWISIKDIVNCGTYIFSTNEFLTQNAIKKFNVPIIQENTTILTFKMTVGKLAITTEKMLSNEAIAHFNLKKDSKFSSEYIYCFLQNYHFDSLGTTSSIVNSINSTMIKELKLFIPNERELKDFDEIIKGVFNVKKNYEKENENLGKMKDLILSKMASES